MESREREERENGERGRGRAHGTEHDGRGAASTVLPQGVVSCSLWAVQKDPKGPQNGMSSVCSGSSGPRDISATHCARHARKNDRTCLYAGVSPSREDMIVDQ